MKQLIIAAALAAGACALPAFAQQANSGSNDANAGSNEANPRHDKQGVPGAKSRSSKTGDADTDASSKTYDSSGRSRHASPSASESGNKSKGGDTQAERK